MRHTKKTNATCAVGEAYCAARESLIAPLRSARDFVLQLEPSLAKLIQELPPGTAGDYFERLEHVLAHLRTIRSVWLQIENGLARSASQGTIYFTMWPTFSREDLDELLRVSASLRSQRSPRADMFPSPFVTEQLMQLQEFRAAVTKKQEDEALLLCSIPERVQFLLYTCVDKINRSLAAGQRYFFLKDDLFREHFQRATELFAETTAAIEKSFSVSHHLVSALRNLLAPISDQGILVPTLSSTENTNLLFSLTLVSKARMFDLAALDQEIQGVNIHP